MFKLKKNFIKKFMAAGMATMVVIASNVPALASEWHYGNVDYEDIISFRTRMNYDYSDGSWCDIYLYSVSVSYISDGYEESKTNEWHSNASGHADYDIYEDGTFSESITVVTSLDEYGDINDYVY